MLLYQCPANKHTSSPNCTGHMKEETEVDTQNLFFLGEFFFFIPHLVLGDFGFPSRHCKKLPFFCDSSGVSSFGPVSLWGAVAVTGRTWTLPLAGDLTESPDMFKVLELLRWRRSSLLKDNREVFYKIIQKNYLFDLIHCHDHTGIETSDQCQYLPFPWPNINFNLLSVDCCWTWGRGKCAVSQILILISI